MSSNNKLLHAVLACLFFTLVGFVFLVGLMDWSE